MDNAYAKINLAINVLGKRKDGYHELDMIMVPLELHDDIEVEKSDKTEIIGMDLPLEDNLMYKAIKLLEKESKRYLPCKITIQKNIPQEAGLAGGSSDCSYVLRKINEIYNLGYTLDELAVIASKLGSDTVFCMYNKPALIQGRGESIQFLNFSIPNYYITLIKPNYGALTKDVFNNLKQYEKRDINLVIKALQCDNLDKLFDVMFNDLENSTFDLYPHLRTLKEAFSYRGYHIMMSGSGTTLFIISKEKITIKEDENYQVIYTKIKSD